MDSHLEIADKKDDLDVGVDQLLAVADLTEVRRPALQVEMETGTYDLAFFDANRKQSGTRTKSVRMSAVATPKSHLDAAQYGLAMFLDEADEALATEEMTIDQRVHVATMVSLVEGLAARLKRVSVPGFIQLKDEPTKVRLASVR